MTAPGKAPIFPGCAALEEVVKMVATIKGQFLEQGTFNRKTGETVAYSEVLCEDNTVVQINDYIPPAGTKKFDPVNIRVKIHSTKFGLLIRNADK